MELPLYVNKSPISSSARVPPTTSSYNIHPIHHKNNVLSKEERILVPNYSAPVTQATVDKNDSSISTTSSRTVNGMLDNPVKAAATLAVPHNDSVDESHHLDYIPFDNSVVHKTATTTSNDDDTVADCIFGSRRGRYKVDSRMFVPLYVTTALLVFLPMLPQALVTCLVTVWAVLFVATPVWYLIHYDPLGEACGACHGGGDGDGDDGGDDDGVAQ